MVTNLGQGTVTTIDTVPGGSMQVVSKSWLDDAGRILETQQYTGQPAAPNSGQAVQTYTTYDAYDDSGRLYWTQAAVGTITETEFDGLGRPTYVSIGTDDSNLRVVQADDYDDAGVGDGNLTQQISYPGGFNPATQAQFTGAYGPPRVAQSYYDWQDRPVAQNNGLQITYNTLDNLGEVTEARIYDATQPNTQIVMGADGVPQPPANASALRAETTTLYDNQGQAYCTRVFSVNPISGAVNSANYLETDIYHDGRGDVVATLAPGGLLTTASFDGAGRVTLQASGNASGTPGIIGTVVQSVATQYDGDCNPIFVTTKQLNPDGTTYWTTYVANWYNAQDQVTTTANYGASTSQRPPTPPTVSTSTVLVTGDQYDAGGFLSMTTDTAGMQTTYSNDWLGRPVTEVVNSAATGLSTLSTLTTSTYDGLGRKIVATVRNITPAVGSTPSKTQYSITQYNYGVTTAKGSAINSNDLLWVSAHKNHP